MCAGMTIIENMIAGGIVVFFLSGLFALSSHSVRRLHAQKETASVNLCLQQRVEQVRAATWTQIVTAEGIRKMLTAAVPGSEKLPHLDETITVSVYPPPDPLPTPIAVLREEDGTVRTLSEPADGSLTNASLVRVDFSESWKSGQSMRPRLRETSTVIALGGIVK